MSTNKPTQTLEERALLLGNRLQKGERFLSKEARDLIAEIHQINPPYVTEDFSSSVVPLKFSSLTSSLVQNQEDIDRLSSSFNKILTDAKDQFTNLTQEQAAIFVTEVRDYFFGDFKFNQIYKDPKTKSVDVEFNFLYAIGSNLWPHIGHTISSSSISGILSYLNDYMKKDRLYQKGEYLNDETTPTRLAVLEILKKRNIKPYQASDFTSTVLPIQFEAEANRPKSEEEVKAILKKFDHAFSDVRDSYQKLSDSDKGVFIKETCQYFQDPTGVLGEYKSDEGNIAEPILTTILGGNASHDEKNRTIDHWYNTEVEHYIKKIK